MLESEPRKIPIQAVERGAIPVRVLRVRGHWFDSYRTLFPTKPPEEPVQPLIQTPQTPTK